MPGLIGKTLKFSGKLSLSIGLFSHDAFIPSDNYLDISKKRKQEDSIWICYKKSLQDRLKFSRRLAMPGPDGAHCRPEPYSPEPFCRRSSAYQRRSVFAKITKLKWRFWWIMKNIVETLLEVAESHLLWRNTLLLLNTLLDSIDLVRRLDVDLNLLASEGLR